MKNVWTQMENSVWQAAARARKQESLGTAWGVGRTNLDMHLKHNSEIRPGAGPHSSSLYCLDCNKHIKWLTKQETQIARELGLIKWN
jgi:hypothetical protein